MRNGKREFVIGRPIGPRGLGYAIYFGATCNVCGWEMRDPSFAVASLAGEDHAKKHGVDLLRSAASAGRFPRTIDFWKGRPIVDVWKEDGL